MRIARHLRIEGRVQGVGYRYGMQAKARELGISGWVRNCRDGSVEAVISRDDMRLIDEMIAWAQQGPRLADVTRIQVSEAEVPTENDFIIRSTV
jgi:acylphosphatase